MGSSEVLFSDEVLKSKILNEFSKALHNPSSSDAAHNARHHIANMMRYIVIKDPSVITYDHVIGLSHSLHNLDSSNFADLARHYAISAMGSIVVSSPDKAMKTKILNEFSKALHNPDSSDAAHNARTYVARSLNDIINKDPSLITDDLIKGLSHALHNLDYSNTANHARSSVISAMGSIVVSSPDKAMKTKILNEFSKALQNSASFDTDHKEYVLRIIRDAKLPKETANINPIAPDNSSHEAPAISSNNNHGMERLNRIASHPRFSGAFIGLGLLEVGMGLETKNPTQMITGLGMSAIGTADDTFDYLAALRNKEFTGKLAKVRGAVSIGGRTLLGAGAVMSSTDAAHAFAEGDYDRAVKSTTAAAVTGSATAKGVADYVAKKATGQLASNAGKVAGSRALALVGGPYTLAALAVAEIGVMGFEMRSDNYYGKAEKALAAENPFRITYLNKNGKRGPSILTQNGVDASLIRIKRLKSESSPNSAWKSETENLITTMAWNRATGNTHGLQNLKLEDFGAEGFWGSSLQTWPTALREWCEKTENRKHCYGASLNMSQTWGGYGGTSSNQYNENMLKPAQTIMLAYINSETEKRAKEFETDFNLGRSDLLFAKEQNSYEHELHQLSSNDSFKGDMPKAISQILEKHPNVMRMKQIGTTKTNLRKMLGEAGLSDREIASNESVKQIFNRLSDELSTKSIKEDELTQKIGLLVLLSKMPNGTNLSLEKAEELYARIDDKEFISAEIEKIYQSFVAQEKQNGDSKTLSPATDSTQQLTH